MKQLKVSHWSNLFFWLYETGITTWLMLRPIIGEIFWWMVLLNHAGSLLLFLVLPVTLLVILFRRWRLLHYMTVPLLTWLWFHGAYMLPRPAVDESPTLTVMTYNVLFRNTDYAAIARNIRTYQPDLVALQEASPELMDALASELGAEYPYAHIASGKPDYSTTALLSRHPLDELYQIELGAIRPALVARLTLDGHTIKFISAHLLFYGLQTVAPSEIPAQLRRVSKLQNEQARRITQEAKRHKDEIVILGCDCNSTDTSITQSILARTFRNAARETGWRLPLPALPRLGPFYLPHRIDFVHYRGALKPLGVYTVYDRGGSDHFAVLARFEWRE